ncbi:hypothetical protein CAEBREN_04537 [Caenorhabditis brenneri]|uniref:Uncharacterized protein n=1 Tax=Caenorhabditis brenneri TaxID=135651 RepID=G0P1V5_CAEBE|nr:hypothetical protein CAEBREN_04537 [Caenorhabditis brenneri]
MIVGGVFCWD